MKILIAMFVSTSLLLVPAWGSDQATHVVLVSAGKQPPQEFTRKELRLLYLGYAITINEQQYEPLINATQKQIYKGFLQKIMFMSEKNYERQLVARIFRRGGERPGKFSSRNELIANLKMKPNRITFVRLDFALQDDDIQVVQQLW